MSYQVIARKWRPRTFDEVTGQSHVTTPLRNAIRSDRVPHAILLTGPRGVGKTTLARILARCLNCEKGPTDEPCGDCVSCQEIAGGTSTDVQEIDAASRTGVDDVREVIESIRYAPSPGKHRIFVVDEVHMLSTAAFNALLKTLEEPPPRSLFVFATTNPEKIPFTVISRCQRYDLRLFSTAEIAARLAEICRADDVTISETSLLAVSREGQGSMRDAQTLLDQVIAYGGTEVADETVVSVLDLVDRRVLLEIIEACVASDPARALEACHHAVRSGTDAKRLSSSLIQLLRDLVVLRVAPKSENLVEGSQDEIDALRALASSADEARLRRMFRALIREQEDLTWAPEPFAVLEMAIVRLATLPSGDDVSALLGRLDQLERRLGGGLPTGGGPPAGGNRTTGPRQPKAAAGSPAAASSTSASTAEPSATASSTPAPTVEASRAGAAVSGAPDRGAAKRAGEMAPPIPPPTPMRATGVSGASASSAAVDVEAPAEVVLDRLRVFAQKHDRGLFASLDGARLLERSQGKLKLGVANGFHLKRLADRLTEVQDVCARFFGEPTRVELTQGDAGRATGGPGAPTDTTPHREIERQRKQEALNHPGVNVALEELQGEIVEIRPIRGK